jgi:hypothetical protein
MALTNEMKHALLVLIRMAAASMLMMSLAITADAQQPSIDVIVSSWLYQLDRDADSALLPQQLADAGDSATPALITAAQAGPDQSMLQLMAARRGAIFDEIRAKLAAGDNLGLSPEQVLALQSMSKQQTISNDISNYVYNYKERALYGLAVVGTDASLNALRQFAADSSDPAVQKIAQEALDWKPPASRIAPTVTFTGAPTSAAYNSAFTVTATTNASTTAVITASGVCSITGNTVTMTSGTGTCSLTANWEADSNYAAASATQSTSASKATPVITWATPAAITYGTALSGTQLNATGSVAGTFAYNPLAGTVLGAGSQILSVTLTPTDTTDYRTVTAQVTLPVNKATPVIAWTPAAIQLGYSLGAAQLDATASISGTFAYTPPSGTVITSSSQTLSVLFTPTDIADYTNANVSVSLAVTPGPLASVSPSSINFGTVYLGTITSKQVTVTNQGNAPMTITDPFLSIVSGGNSNEFVAVNLCPKSLAAGRSCTINVSFVAGPFYATQTATLSIRNNAPGNPQTVSLTAVVINPQASLSAYSLNFGKQKVGTTSAAQTVTLTNTGTTSLSLTTLNLGGDFSFATGTTCTSGETLVAGASCLIKVNFTPTAKGARAGSVTIKDNALLKQQIIVLAGTGN